MKYKRLFILLLLSIAAPTSLFAVGPRYTRSNDSLHTIAIDKVVVTGTRSSETTRNLPMSVSIVTSEQLVQRQEQSVLPILVERVPGLMITSRGLMGYGSSTGGAGAMSMRGVGGGMLVLIDGHPQFMGIFSHPLNDTYQTIMAERIEVVRGPAAVLYGQNSLAGVINIITRKQREDGIHTRIRTMYGSFTTLSAEAINQIRHGKFHSVLSVGYNRSDGHRPNMEFGQYSAYAKTGYDFSRHWKSSIDFNLSKTLSSNPGTTTSPMIDNDMNILRGITSLSLTNVYNRTSGEVNIYYNFGKHYINDGYGPGGAPRQNRFNSTDWLLGISAYQNYSLWRGNRITLGMDFQRYGGHAWTSYLNGDPHRNISREYMNDMAGYFNFRQMVGNKLSLDAGIRLDHHSVTRIQWIPQFGASWFAGDNTTLKAVVSKGYRNPTMRELYMWGPANPALKPESLMNYELGANWMLIQGSLSVEMNLYYIKGNNSIVETPYTDEEGNTRYRWDNTGEIENYGVELIADYHIHPRLVMNINYSYLHMERLIAASPEHKFYAGIDYRPGRWILATGFQYVGKMVTQAPDPTNPDIKPDTDSFLLWNARVMYKAAKWLDIFVRGENLLNWRYETYKGYPMPGITLLGGISLNF